MPRKLLPVLFLFLPLFQAGFFQSFQARPLESVRPYQYLYPLPGSRNLNPGVTLAIRYGTAFQASDLSGEWFYVSGSASGKHAGKTILSVDGSTLLFKPDQPFALGETVAVTIDPAAAGRTGLERVDFTFEVRGQLAPPVKTVEFPGMQAKALPGRTGPTRPSAPAAGKYVTAPADLPQIQVTTPANGTADGDLFLASFNWYADNPLMIPISLLILDNSGELVYYDQKLDGGLGIYTDFKKQPNGQLTFFDGSRYDILNENYQLVDTVQAGNGYSLTDLHELKILPNGNALLLIYDTETEDMSAYGGVVDAQVIGLVIQELDPLKNVVFEWRSWDHFQVTDTQLDITYPVLDYVHGNALELDQDGNILLSSRHLSEITKINHQTGAIIWRLGGKNNQFTFIGDPNNGFTFQHDIRRLPNGHITLFDNRTNLNPAYSRALEYQLDENAKTATLVWSYTNPLDTYAFAMGNFQRLPNGNSLIDWGSGSSTLPIQPFANVTEVKPDGSKALEFSLPAGYVSYRAFRFPWHATPSWPPALVVQNQDQGATTALYYSWNGATDVASYQVYASGKGNPIPTTLIANQPKTGFEDSTLVTGGDTRYCYFQVKPVDTLGRPTLPSEVIPNPACFTNYPVFMPLVTGQ